MSTTPVELAFVYNTNSGLKNQSVDWFLKNFTPESYSCELCLLTHHSFGKKSKFIKWIKSSGITVRYYHKDEWISNFPDLATSNVFPAIFMVTHSKINLILTSEELNQFKHLSELLNLLDQILQKQTTSKN